jgi:drug/metabolite transporter (DMT)-like permease
VPRTSGSASATEPSPSLRSPAPWRIGLVLGIGILAGSTAAILIRLAMAASGSSGPGFGLVIAAGRLALSGLVLTPLLLPLLRTPPPASALRYTVSAGVMLAFHFAGFITSLWYTSITAGVTLSSSSPVWIALLSWLWLNERLGPLRFFALLVSLGGALVIGLSQSGSSAGTFTLVGNMLALAAAGAVSVYFLLGRQAQRHGLTAGQFTALSCVTGALVLSPFPLLAGSSYTGHGAEVYLYILLIALIPQLIGHTIYTWTMRWIAPTVVSLIMLAIPALSSVLGYLVFGEVPGRGTVLGAAVLLLGLVLATLSLARKRKGA